MAPMSQVPDASRFRNFADLARSQVRGRDYEICVRRRAASPIAIIAPHGGEIEDGTWQMARAIAGDDFNLYCFEGTRPSKNYTALHLTSHRFDEPECLSLIASCPVVIAVHGCGGATCSPRRSPLPRYGLKRADIATRRCGRTTSATAAPAAAECNSRSPIRCARGARRRGSPRRSARCCAVSRLLLEYLARVEDRHVRRG